MGGTSVLTHAVVHGGVERPVDADGAEADGPDRRADLDRARRSARGRGRSDAVRARAGRRRAGAERGGGMRRSGARATGSGPSSGSASAGSVGRLVGSSASSERHEAPAPHGRRRHRRPAQVELGHPAALDLGQHGVGRPGGLVAAQDLAQVVVLLLDDAHPDPQHPLAQRRDRVDPAGLAGAWRSARDAATRPSRSSWARAR